MSRRSLLIASALLVAARIARAQAATAPFRLGYLFNGLPASELRGGTPAHPQPLAFVAGLQERGWIDGRNLRILWRTAEGRFERFDALVRELLHARVDVIVAGGPGTLAAARITRSVPIVTCASYDPVGAGLAESLARPGRNVTGLTVHPGNEKLAKQLSLLKQIVPGITRVAVVVQSRSGEADYFPQLPAGSEPLLAAEAARMDLFVLPFGDSETLPAVLRSAARQGAQAVLFDDEPLLHQVVNQRRIAAEAARLKMPVICSTLSAAAGGVLAAYGNDTTVAYRRAAYFVDRILRGANPGELPIEQPASVMLHVNLEAARALGREIPQEVLLQADRVFP